MRVSIVLLILVTVVLVGTSLVMGQELRGKHKENDLACVDCHKTETPVKRAPASACMECHDGYPQIGELTALVKPNPHSSHQGELRCTVCHNIHKPSVNYCAECHDYNFNVK